MQYANVKPDRLLSLTFEKTVIEIDLVMECESLIDYLVTANSYDKHFRVLSVRDNITQVIKYQIGNTDKSIVKVYTSKGEVYVKQHYS